METGGELPILSRTSVSAVCRWRQAHRWMVPDGDGQSNRQHRERVIVPIGGRRQ
jgi:hypothetical protein